MKNLKKYYLLNKGKLIFVLVSTLIATISNAGITWTLYLMLTAVENGVELTEFIYVGLACIGCVALTVFMCFVSNYSLRKYVNAMTTKYRQDITENILNADYASFNEKTTGEYVTLVQKDVETISNDHFVTMLYLFQEIVSLIVSVGLAFYLNYVVAIVLLLLSVVVILSSNLFVKKIQKQSNEMSDASLELSRLMKTP